MKKNVSLFRILFLILWVSGLCISCKQKAEVVPPEEITTQIGGLTIGEMKQVSSEIVGTAGGILQVSDTHSPLNGFKIQIPVNNLREDTPISISCANVIKQSFGEEYKVISPLISITGPLYDILGLYDIEIPINLPESHFAAAVAIDENGKPTPLSLITLSKNAIRIVTNSLSGIRIKENSNAKTVSYNHLNIIILSIPEKILIEGSYGTGFDPKKDGWRFVNNGSIISPKGFCNGAVFSALWYFENRKNNNSENLFDIGRLSSSPQTSESKSLAISYSNGIKFVSTIQNSQVDIGAIGVLWELVTRLNPDKAARDRLSFLVISLTLKLTSAPLLLALGNSAISSSHMVMIIGKDNGRIKVYDPNFPGETKYIELDSNGFHSFKSGERYSNLYNYNYFVANHLQQSNKNIKIEENWEKFENETIGQDDFPKYIFNIKSKNGLKVLNDNYNEVTGKFNIEVIYNSIKQKVSIYGSDGKVIPLKQDGYTLPPGNRNIGIFVEANYNGTEYLWADFKWLNLNVLEDTDDSFISFITDGVSYYYEGFATGNGGNKTILTTKTIIEDNIITVAYINFLPVSEYKGVGRYEFYTVLRSGATYWEGIQFKAYWKRSNNVAIASTLSLLAANDLVFKPKSGYLEITKDDGNYIEGKFEYVMSNQLGIQHPNSEVVDGKFKCKILE